MLALLALLRPPLGAAQRADSREQLRKLAKLPNIGPHFSFAFSSDAGFAILPEPTEAGGSVAEIRQGLKGNHRDAESYQLLGNLSRQANDRAIAAKYFAKAAQLWRQRLDLQPGNPAVLSDLGVSLFASKKYDEARFYLNEAVALAPHEAKYHLALAQFLDTRAWLTLGGQVDLSETPSLQARVEILAENRPSVAEIDQSRALMREAGEHFDRAVELKPGDPQALFKRACHRASEAALNEALRILAEGGDRRQKAALNLFAPEALADLAKARALDPDDWRIVGTLALAQSCSSYISQTRAAPEAGTSELWNYLSEGAKSSVQEGMATLERVGESSEPKPAAAALATLGLLQHIVFHNERAAASNLKRAVRLDPSGEKAWDLWIDVLSRFEEPAEWVAACEERLKRKRAARNRLLLAKAYDKAGEPELAEQQIRTAAETNSTDYSANLSLAVILIKVDDPESNRVRIRDALAKAERGLGLNPPVRQVLALAVAQSVFFGMTGDEERARQIAKGILEVEKDNAEALQILELLGY